VNINLGDNLNNGSDKSNKLCKYGVLKNFIARRPSYINRSINSKLTIREYNIFSINSKLCFLSK